MCAGCARRIRRDQPHIGVLDYERGREIPYHAACQERAAEDMSAMLERGHLYVISHYHVCPDESPSLDCSEGCFSGKLGAASFAGTGGGG